MLDTSKLHSKLKARIDELKAERDNFTVQANQQVIAYNAVIGELEKLAEGSDNGRAVPQVREVPKRMAGRRTHGDTPSNSGGSHLHRLDGETAS